ncbi:odorant receptor 85b-like [Bombus pyrosoma]|uniref:odorant receptor 85b-like n=1 Tax=Bombus pyrosoma TaxID=396416 RepID=UPI001CB8C913|nr:odorant receptor 85b-like [Bombus pyrosoma]
MEKLILIYSNVLQLSKTITDAKDEKEIFIYIFLLISYLVFLYLCCHSGQIMVDRSLNVFKETYHSTWYCMPIKAQKLLLFIMLRSSTESVINLFGFFVASHVGFWKMLSTSVSYFTMIYSFQ